MITTIALLIGFAAGYFFGKEAGRYGYKKMTDKDWEKKWREDTERIDDELFK